MEQLFPADAKITDVIIPTMSVRFMRFPVLTFSVSYILPRIYFQMVDDEMFIFIPFHSVPFTKGIVYATDPKR